MTSSAAAFDPERLAAQQDFVRRLAHSLVFDRRHADDAVQEAWLAALRRPPRHAAAVPTWFGRVLHNFARRSARDDLRRAARERQVARPEALPAADDLVQREQERRRVVDAVMALAEPYRGVVLARFFEELSPRDIARQRGVPAATVRSQLARGLEMLRQRLDAAHGGDRRAWCVLLAPLARKAGTGTGSLAAIATAMTMTKVLCAGTVALLAVLGLLWWNASSTPGSGDLLAVAPPPAAAAATGNALRVDAAPTSIAPRTALVTGMPPRAADAAAGSAGLRGRIVDAQGNPLAGTLVRVLGIDGVTLFADGADPDRAGPALPRGETRARADGTFAIAGMWPRIRYAVQATRDDGDRTLLLVDATPAPGETIDLGDIAVHPKGTVVGRAVDDEGAPVAGAEVFAWDLPAALTAILPFERFAPLHGAFLTVAAPKTTAASADACRDALRSYFGSDLFVNTDIDERDDVQTLVLDGAPWMVDVFQMLPAPRTATAADGSFTLRGVEPGANMLVVRRQGLLPAMRPRVAATGGQTIDVGELRLAAGLQLAGTVRQGGVAVANAEVRVAALGGLGYRGFAFADPAAHAGADGHFVFAGLPRGRALLAARRSPDAAWTIVGPVETDENVDVELPAGNELVAQLTPNDGAALREAKIELFVGPPLGELRRLGLQAPLPLQHRVQWRADDTFALTDLPSGCVSLRVTAPGRVPVEQVVVLPHVERLTLALDDTAPLQVHARDADGKPLAGATVYLLPQDDAAADRNVLPTDYGLPRWRHLPFAAAVTDAAGDAAITTRPHAAVIAIATHPDLPPALVEVAADAADATLSLPRPGELRGRLFDHGRVPAPGAWTIVAIGDDLGPLPARELRQPVAADGTFAFRGLAAGTYRLHAAARAIEPMSLHALVDRLQAQIFTFWGEDPPHRDVVVAAGATATLTFDVDPNAPAPDEPAAHLVGRASIDGAPLAGALLVRRIDYAHSAPLATVAADGSFVVAAIAPGEHELWLQQDSILWSGSVQLSVGTETTLDLALVTGTLRGRVATATPGWLEDLGAIAAGRCANGTVERAAQIAADGSFEFTQLPAGDYEVRIAGEHALADAVTVHVAAGQVAEAPAFTLRGRPQLRGRIELGDRRGKTVWIALTSPRRHVTSFYGVGDDGRFSVTQLAAEEYELGVSIDDAMQRVEPASVDLRAGEITDIVVRVLGPAAR